MASRKFIQDYNNNQVPFALIELIFIRQEEAGNVKDISVFLNQEGHDERLGGFTWEDTSEKHNFWRKIFEGNYSEFTSLKYTDFKEGDYGVARTNIHGHWFSNDEVLQLGGQYWNGSLEKHFGVKCKRYPEGGGMSYAFQANYTIRHATAKEIRKSIFNPEEFLKGDYIVITGLPVYKTNVTINYHLQYPEAFIFKQRDTNKTYIESYQNTYDCTLITISCINYLDINLKEKTANNHSPEIVPDNIVEPNDDQLLSKHRTIKKPPHKSRGLFYCMVRLKGLFGLSCPHPSGAIRKMRGC